MWQTMCRNVGRTFFSAATSNYALFTIQVLHNISKRAFSVASMLRGQSRVMNKILKGPRKSTRKLNFTESPILPAHNAVAAITNDKTKSVNTKRINMLNKVFMGYITDLMANGAYSAALTGHGIEINRVKIAPDFQRIQVYWLSRNEGPLEDVESMLKQHAGRLRHELSQLRVMGNVPRLDFVKDEQHTMLRLLDDKLSQADFGPDHEVSDHVEKLKHEFELQTNLGDKIKKQIEYLDKKTSHVDEEPSSAAFSDDFDVPIMPQNVLGVDHAEIMSRLVKNISRTQHKKEDMETTTEKGVFPPLDINENPVTYPSMKLQREALREFLHQRDIMKLKAMKRDKTYRPEWDFLEDEGRRQYEARLQKHDIVEYFFHDDDFVEDADK